MASTLNVVVGALVAAAIWTCLGLPLARRIAPPPLSGMLAPVLGWAVSSAVALPVLTAVGLSSLTVRSLVAAGLAGSLIALWRTPALAHREGDGFTLSLSWIGAAILAIAPAVSILPKYAGDSVFLAPAIFDHSKVAIVDEMTRLGLPPGNPFFGEAGGSDRLAYYYLFHFSAAILALLTGISGWEADAAMTWFAAFASLLLMSGLAAFIGGRMTAALWVLPFAAAASLRETLSILVPGKTLNEFIVPASGFSAWLGHASWAPQHLISASCVILTAWLMGRLVGAGSPLIVGVIGLVAAAGIQSSTWVGGVAFIAIALPVAAALMMNADSEVRARFAGRLALAAALAACLAAPFALDQVSATAAREIGAPIVLQVTPVLGDFLPEWWRQLLDLPAFWLVYLPLEYPVIYPVGVAAFIILLRSRDLGAPQRQATLVLASLAVASLVVSWLLRSRVGYNDLGWRAAIPGMMALTIASAVVTAQWLRERALSAIIGVFALLAVGLHEAVVQFRESATGVANPQGAEFATAPDLWAAIRQHSAPWERVANNPLSSNRMTPWPGNISWALLSDRRSCFAGDQLALAFAPLPASRREQINRQFIRVFAGKGTADDVRTLSETYDCAIAVVTTHDGAWENDPFASNSLYALADSRDGQWRIYRRKAPRQVRREHHADLSQYAGIRPDPRDRERKWP